MFSTEDAPSSVDPFPKQPLRHIRFDEDSLQAEHGISRRVQAKVSRHRRAKAGFLKNLDRPGVEIFFAAVGVAEVDNGLAELLFEPLLRDDKFGANLSRIAQARQY